MNELFRRVAQRAAAILGSARAFVLAALTILIWALAGPLYHFSDSWQLLINTWTSVATFLMVFVIQNSQNRDTKAMLLKLDELIRAQAGARNALINLEELSESELERLDAEFKRLRERYAHTGAVATVPRQPK